MLRGKNALMGIVSNDLKTVSEKHVKGCFTTGRDDALAARFYYHAHLLGKRYDVCLSALNKEFFLSETVITQRLMTRQGFIKELRVDNTTAKDLQQLYPHYSWRQ
jgi:hypothetical protein